MKTQTTLIVAIALSLTALAAKSDAAEFYTAFTVVGFEPSNGNAAPNDPLSGTIFWTAPDIHSDIQSIVSINLILDGHQYSTSEIGYLHLDTTWSNIGGTIDFVNGVGNLSDDFSVIWDSSTLQPVLFSYASSKRSGIWEVDIFHQSNAFQNFVVAPVPEPGSMSLLLAGLLGAGAWGWKHRTES